ncbi:MAG: hypothetical protein KAH17_05440 [Bacteroidales bacterium]|nr:hypothetical protein [Bacteroidales bacterium]
MPNRFRYKSAEELKSNARDLGFQLPWSDDFSNLFDSFQFGKLTVPNKFVVHPMEGFDSNPDGSPGDLTRRRYRRYAQGGSGLIWIEATSVTPDGRSNPAQLFINAKNQSEFSGLIDAIHNDSKLYGSQAGEVKTVIQLTHSGRYAKPEGKPAPLIDPSDDDLKRIRDAHIEGAILAEKAGFDAIDIKICHGYLLHELLFATDRMNTEFGGKELDKRIRIVEEIVKGIRETNRAEVVIRLNVFDGLEGGFGVSNNDAMSPDLTEVEEIIARMDDLGVSLWSITAGIPYLNPWIGRPFDLPAKNTSTAPEHPLVGINRLISLTHEVSKTTSVPVVGTGLSWLRQYFPFVAAGIIKENKAHAIGMGRLSFAYPDLPNDLFKNANVDAKKVCVACSGCTSRMREGLTAGCIIRDREVYA